MFLFIYTYIVFNRVSILLGGAPRKTHQPFKGNGNIQGERDEQTL